MPKEQINTPARRLVGWMREDDGTYSTTSWFSGWAQDGETLKENEHWENTPVLHIGWHGNSGSLDDSSLILEFEIDADEVLRAAAQIQARRESFQAGSGDSLIESWPFGTVVLTRPEAQKLIRVTKRARDAVFEADE